MATIQGIYIALFGRPADPVGLDYFNRATGNGANLNAIGDLASTPEYQSRFAGLNSTEIVTAIYQSLFARNPEPEGLLFFVNALAAGTYTINNVAIAVLDGAQGPDLDIVRNKLAAAKVFTDAIDTGDELAAYRGNQAADAGRAFITPVTEDSGTVPTADDADDALGALVNGLGPSSQFVLTAGYDTADTKGAFTDGGPGDTGTIANFKFTDANETILATTETLGRFDSLIDGSTADEDRLKLTLTGDATFGAVKNIETLEIEANTAATTAINLALVSGAKTLEVSGLLGGYLLVLDAGNSGITTFDGSGLNTTVDINSLHIDLSTSGSTLDRTFIGSLANDEFKAGGGNDTLTGGEGDDSLLGGAGNDTFDGGAGIDGMAGGAGNDILRGGAGMDFITADAGMDTVVGGEGNDQIFLALDYVGNLFVADSSIDTIVFEATAATNGTDGIAFFETGGTGPDRLDVSAFLGAPIQFSKIGENVIGQGAAGFDGTAFNVFSVATEKVDTVEELAAAIGIDKGDLTVGANARVVVAMQTEGAVSVFFVTTDANGVASEVGLVGQLGSVNAMEMTGVNFV